MPWQFWILQGSPHNSNYVSNMNRSNALSTFEEFILYLEENPSRTCALFREGMTPVFEDYSAVFIHTSFAIQQIEVLNAIKDQKIMDMDYVYGIYRTKKKISIWSSKPESKNIMSTLNDYGEAKLEKKEQETAADTFSPVRWNIGVIHKWNFRTFQEYLSSSSVDEIYQLFLKNGPLNVHRCGKVTVLMPDTIPESAKYRKNFNNRFVYCSARMDINDAERIQKYYILSIILSIFPKVPNISYAFYAFDGEYLELGVYLSGDPSVEITVDRNVLRWPEFYSLNVGHKIKQLLLTHCPLSEEIYVSIKNLIPSQDYKCTDDIYEFDMGASKNPINLNL